MEEGLDSFSTLERIIARLRAPDGCPWDRKQTAASLKSYLLEECYEAIEALDQGDSRGLCEELGDLLLQIVLQSQIASETSYFTIRDVLRSINTKLIRRHPHVFGGEKVEDAQEVAANWEVLKQEEHQGEDSLLAGLPQTMPALAYSQAMQRRAARAGFEWERTEEISERVEEAIKELKQVTDHKERQQKLGGLVFFLADSARKLDIDLEEAVRLANQQFRHCLSYIEKECRQRGLSWGELSVENKKALWEKAQREDSPSRDEVG